MLQRALESALVAVVVFLLAWGVIEVISLLLPGIDIDGRFWAGIIGVLVFFVNLFSGRVWYNRPL